MHPFIGYAVRRFGRGPDRRFWLYLLWRALLKEIGNG